MKFSCYSQLFVNGCQLSKTLGTVLARAVTSDKRWCRGPCNQRRPSSTLPWFRTCLQYTYPPTRPCRPPAVPPCGPGRCMRSLSSGSRAPSTCGKVPSSPHAYFGSRLNVTTLLKNICATGSFLRVTPRCALCADCRDSHSLWRE